MLFYHRENDKQPQETHQNNANEEQQSDDDSDQFATIKRCPKDMDKKTSSTPTTPQDYSKNESIENDHIQQITEQQFVDEMLYGDNIKARALYDYQAGIND